MKKTGQMLQDLRIQKGQTLSEVSSALKINLKVLHALESGETSVLPKPAFVRGFIKSYALHLKSDPEPFLKEYQKEIGTSLTVLEGDGVQDLSPLSSEPPPPSKVETLVPDEAPTPLASPKEMKTSADLGQQKSQKELSYSYSDFDTEEKQRGGWRVVIFGLIVFILSLVIYVAFRTIERYQRETVITAETEKTLGELAASGVSLPESSSPLPEGTETEATPTIEEQSQEVMSSLDKAIAQNDSTHEEAVSPKEPVTTSSQKPEEAPTAAASDMSMKKTAEIAPTTSGTTAPPQEETTAAPKPPQRVREIIIEASDNLRVDYDASGKKGTLQLKKDQVHILRVTKSATLKLSDGGAANISVDGTDRGVAGEKGSPIVVRY